MIELEKVLDDYRRRGVGLTDVREVKSGKEATLFVAGWDGPLTKSFLGT